MKIAQAEHLASRLLSLTRTARSRRAVFALLLIPALITITQRTYGQVTFSSAASFPAGLQPWNIISGDFNGDGKTDLAVVNKNGNNVSVLLGNGNGTFQPAVNYPVGNSPTNLVVNDLNRDGNSDIMAANTLGHSLSVLLGTSTGTFQSAVNYAIPIAPQAVAAGDFNGDG